MEYRKLGNAGIEVSALSLGSWKTFEFVDRESGLAVLRAALDAGVNFLDDARYDDTTGEAPIKSGYSEIVFGELLRASGRKREDLVIANKLWFEFYPEENAEAELDGSLDRIGIDHVDLIYGVTPPEKISAGTLVEETTALIASGKARCWGLANASASLVAECCSTAESKGAPLPCALQLPYSLIKRSPVEDGDMGSLCSKYDLAVVASFSLEGGVLTGKYNHGEFPRTLRGKSEDMAKLKEDGTLEKVERVMRVAGNLDATAAQVALAYCLKNPHTCSVLFGASTPEQVAEDLGALDVLPRLDGPTLSTLRAIPNSGTDTEFG